MPEPARPPYSLPYAALPSFFHALSAQTNTDSVSEIPDNAIYSTRLGVDFRLVFNASGIARHFTLVGTFVDTEQRLHLGWKMETAPQLLLFPCAGAILAGLCFLMGLTSKDGPQIFTMLLPLMASVILYLIFRSQNGVKNQTEKRLLEVVQKCIDEAEESLTQSTTLQSAPAPTQPTP